MDAAFDLGDDPWRLFRAWYDEAVRGGLPDPDAMTLATATRAGRPSARMVLYKGVREGGLCFLTNYESRKARELEENPLAALVFHWAPLKRQVRIEGSVEKLSGSESDHLFGARPRESQLSAWASPQSQPIANRALLEASVRDLDETYSGRTVPRPPFWGGYRVIPALFEFWIGREHRLHDRFLYVLTDLGWSIERLAP